MFLNLESYLVMITDTITETIPLRKDKDGVIRIEGSRITLDVVVNAFNAGATAEEIVYQYPTLKLADVYAVISYYLRRYAEIETYLTQRRKSADKIRQENEARFPARGIRERLLARTIERKE